MMMMTKQWTKHFVDILMERNHFGGKHQSFGSGKMMIGNALMMAVNIFTDRKRLDAVINEKPCFVWLAPRRAHGAVAVCLRFEQVYHIFTDFFTATFTVHP
jgi:hypothetical protein